MAGVRKFPVVDGMKKCIACEQNLPFTAEFYTRDKSAPGGLTGRCKACRYSSKRAWEKANPVQKRAMERAYYAKTRDQYLPRKQDWRGNNRDKDRATALRYAKRHPEKVKAMRSAWMSIPANRVAMALRARMRRCITGGRAVYRDFEAMMGYSIDALVAHLETTFTDGMSWANYTYRGWHVDHIRPVSSFNLTNENGTLNLDEIRRCWALDNLQAMWGVDNMRKSNKYTSDAREA